MENNIPQLKKKINNIDKLILEYSNLREGTDNIGMKKSYEFFISHMVKKKLTIREIIDDIYRSIITMPSNNKE